MIPANEVEAFRQVWVHVLLRAIRDLFDPDPNGLAVHQVRSWIGSRDFREVCQMAGFDWRQVRNAMQALDLEVSRPKRRGSGRVDGLLVHLGQKEIAA